MKVITKGREDQKTPNLDDMDGRWSLNKLVDLDNDSTYLSPVVLRNCPPEDENLETLKKVLALLGRPSSEELDTTDNDTQLRRAALSRLEILLEDKCVQNYFFSQFLYNFSR